MRWNENTTAENDIKIRWNATDGCITCAILENVSNVSHLFANKMLTIYLFLYWTNSFFAKLHRIWDFCDDGKKIKDSVGIASKLQQTKCHYEKKTRKNKHLVKVPSMHVHFLFGALNVYNNMHNAHVITVTRTCQMN